MKIWPTSHEAAQKRKVQAGRKMNVKSSRGIAIKLICCTALVVLSSAVAFSQIKPTSGALLQIDGTAGSTAVHVKIYDSQIHSGVVQAVPTCSAPDQIPTDAYVLQGGSATGCDPGDDFEVTEANNPAAVHQAFGHTDLSNFHIETHYVCGPAPCGNVPATGAVCNTSGTICANPDSGFVTITNNTGSAFSGTISLTGNSPGMGDPFCPVGGAASDTWSSGLAAGGKVTLALGSQGSVATPKNADSSNCGGFNQPQTLTISNTATSIAKFGKDDYQITPSTANAGDTLDVLPVPVPAGPTGTEPTPAASSLIFGPGTMFPNLKCIPYADFSAPNNPVCVELQLTPHGADLGNYIYTAQNDFNIDANSLAGGVGGPSFLGHHNVPCPDSAFDLNFFLSYTAPNATFGDPLKGSGGGTGSCWVAAFDPNAGAVPVGATVGFVGFQSPVVDTKINVVKAGSTVPIIWQQFAGDGTAETNLSWCVTLNPDGKTCAEGSPSGQTPLTPPPFAPWVFLGTFAVNCPNDTLNTATDTIFSSLASGKSNFQANTPTAGTYQFNWQTVKGSTGCVALVLQYDTGIQVLQAIFKYSKT